MVTAENVKPIFWTVERIEILRDLRAKGEPFQLIGEQLGTTRSAVAGKVSRLGLPPPKVHRAPAVPKRKSRPRKARVVPDRKPRVVIIKPQVTEPPRAPIGFMELRERHCRAIVAYDAFGFAMFCGHPKTGKSWCARHHRLYTQPEGFKRNGKASPHHQ
jgi:hypothetical protein